MSGMKINNKRYTKFEKYVEWIYPVIRDELRLRSVDGENAVTVKG